MEQIHTLGYPINLSKGEKCLQCYVQNWNFRKKKIEWVYPETLQFLDTKKKNNFKIRIKSERKSKNKTVSTLQEDCQPFGLATDISLSLEKGFAFPITTIPLSITTPAEKLRESG